MLNYICKYHIFYNNKIIYIYIYSKQRERCRWAHGPYQFQVVGPICFSLPKPAVHFSLTNRWIISSSHSHHPFFFSSFYFRVDSNLPLQFYYYLILVPKRSYYLNCSPILQYSTVQCETLIPHSAQSDCWSSFSRAGRVP